MLIKCFLIEIALAEDLGAPTFHIQDSVANACFYKQAVSLQNSLSPGPALSSRRREGKSERVYL